MATVPLQDITPRNQYVATSGQTIFPYTFWVSGGEDIAVYVNDTLQILNSHYTVGGVQDMNGGNVVFMAGLGEGDIVTLSRQMPLARTTEFQTGGTFKADVLNFELSKMIAMMQQLQRDVHRSLKLPTVSAANPQLLFVPDPQIGRALVWGEDTLVNGPNAAEIEEAGINAATASHAADTAVNASMAAQAAVGGVRVSGNDTHADALEEKLLAGNGLAAATQNEGDNETRTFALAEKTPFAMAGYRSDGSFNEIFLGDGLLRDNSTLATDRAGQSEAEAGAGNSKMMTPLRTKNAIAAQAAGFVATFPVTAAAEVILTDLDYDSLELNGHLTQTLVSEKLCMQYSTDNGATWINSGYGYEGILYALNGTNVAYSVNSSTHLPIKSENTGTNGAQDSFCLSLDNLKRSGFKNYAVRHYHDYAAQGLLEHTLGIGRHTGTINALRIFVTGSATMTGSFTLFRRTK